MTIYKLEEDPNVYITPTYNANRFVYRMTHIARESSRRLIRNIDLRKNTLMVHGNEIKESLLQKMYESLTLGQKQGHVYVNCNGACYFLISGKGMCKPIQGTIFDWSQFGVVVPNSVHDFLRKQVQEKAFGVEKLNQQLSLKGENLLASKEVKELKDKVAKLVKSQEDLEMNLNKECNRRSLVEFEFETTKIELETTRKKMEELQDQVSSCKEEKQGVEVELEKVRKEVSSMGLELESSNKMLEQSKEMVKMLEEELEACRKESEYKDTKSQSMQDELSSVYYEFNISKNELQTMKLELSSISDELDSTKMMLEVTEKELQQLKNQIRPCKAENHHMENDMRKLGDYLDSINSEVRSTNQKLEQVLISLLWNELMPGNRYFRPRSTRHSSMVDDPRLSGIGLASSLLAPQGDGFDILRRLLPHTQQAALDAANINLPVNIVEDVDDRSKM